MRSPFGIGLVKIRKEERVQEILQKRGSHPVLDPQDRSLKGFNLFLTEDHLIIQPKNGSSPAVFISAGAETDVSRGNPAFFCVHLKGEC